MTRVTESVSGARGFNGRSDMSGHRLGRLLGSTVLVLGAALLSVAPDTAVRAAEQQVLKVALAIPRTQEIAVEVKRYNEKLAALTSNGVQVRIYWGGAAGSDSDVLRKMRAGQMDGAPLSLELVSQFVRQ